MADMFGDDFSGQEPNEDPAAEFLAQQQNEIAGLENDIMGSDLTAQPAVNGAVENGVGDTFDANDGNMFGNPITNGGPQYGNDFGDDVIDPSQIHTSISAADTKPERPRVEAEKVRIWREQNTKLIVDKDRESEKRQKEWLSLARKELEDWERNRNDQLKKTKKGNRTAEAQFIKERDFKIPGTDWEKISKLCDFNPKISKGSKDVTRMRSTLLHLKQHPRAVTVTNVNGN